MEDEVIADIARRVKKTGRYTETAELMAKDMVEQGYSAEKIQAEVMKLLRADKAYQMAVAENTAAYKQEVQDIINQTVAEAKKAGNDIVADAGDMAWNNDLSMWQEQGVDLKQPNSMSQLLVSFQKQTAGELKNLTRSMGFKNTVFGTTGVLNAYQREMDLALLKVATGAFSYDQAVNDCVHRLAQSGLRSIDYASGRSYQIDTAARMCVRTGLSQLSGRITEANLKQTGQDLVITSQHLGSRPEHVPWQNKVFSYSGKNKRYPDFFKETGYGTVAGLKGANCTHDFYPFWEGASVIPDDLEEPAPVTINGREYDYYQVSQRQRKMERDIRATKREIEAQKAIGRDTTALQNQLRKQTADYKQFSADAGVKVKQNRLRVAGGTSDLKKTRVWKDANTSKERMYQKAQKTVETTIENDIMSLRSEIAFTNTQIEDLKKQFSSITEGYSYDDWFKDFKSIEEGYGDITEADEPDVVKLKDISQKLKDLIQKKAQWESQLPVLGGQGTPLSMADALKGANPKFARGTQYAVNCQRCVQTYELRRRGYDVETLPKPKKNNTIVWGNECFVDSSGNTPSFTFNQREKDIRSALADAPDGSRHIIYTAWKNSRSAHVFIAEKENGIIRFVDPQTNKDNVEDYFLLGKEGKFGILRVDDKDITTDSSKLKATVRW